jgi:hypothetical protein
LAVQSVRYQIASWPEEPEVVAEILIGDSDLAVLRKRSGSMELMLYPRADAVEVDANSLIEVLLRARERLTAG